MRNKTYTTSQGSWKFLSNDGPKGKDYSTVNMRALHNQYLEFTEAADIVVNSDVVKGRCLCGNVCFEILATPIWVGYCHCESCRRATGAPVVTFVGVRNTDIRFTEGEREIYESSPGVRRGFCFECGTPLTYEADRFPAYVQLHISTFDDPQRFCPKEHVHYSERVSWFTLDDNLPKHMDSAIGESDEWPQLTGEPT